MAPVVNPELAEQVKSLTKQQLIDIFNASRIEICPEETCGEWKANEQLLLDSYDGKYSVTATGWADLDGELNDVATLEVGRLTDEQYLIVIPDAQEDLDMTFEEFTEIVAENLAGGLDRPAREYRKYPKRAQRPKP